MYAGGLGVHVVYYYYYKRFSQPLYNENRLRLKRRYATSVRVLPGTVRVMQIVVAHDEKATVVGLIFDFDGIGFLKNRFLVLD